MSPQAPNALILREGAIDAYVCVTGEDAIGQALVINPSGELILVELDKIWFDILLALGIIGSILVAGAIAFIEAYIVETLINDRLRLWVQ